MSFIRLNRFQKKEVAEGNKGTEGTVKSSPGSYSSFLLPVTAFFLSLLVVVASGCSGPDANSDNLEVWVWDHREAIGDFSEVWLTISAVGIHPAGESRTEGWVELEPSVQELDLTQYVEGEKVLIVQTAVPPGHYNAVRLTVNRVRGTLKNGQPATIDVLLEPVALDFRVDNGRIISAGLDLVVLDLSDHSGQGYELHVREGSVMGN